MLAIEIDGASHDYKISQDKERQRNIEIKYTFSCYYFTPKSKDLGLQFLIQNIAPHTLNASELMNWSPKSLDLGVNNTKE